MVSENILKYIKNMPASEQTRLGREMLELRANGTPEELIDDVISKRLNVPVSNNNGEIKEALGEILTNVKDHKKTTEAVNKLKQDLDDIKTAISGIQVFQTDLPPISGKDFGMAAVAPVVDIGSTKGMESKMVIKEESRKDDISSIADMLRAVKESSK